MVAFPNWRARLHEYFGLTQSADAIIARARYGMRRAVEGRDVIAPDLAYDFIREIAMEAGIDMPNDPATPMQFIDPGSMQYVDIPTSVQQLVVYLMGLQERVELAADEILGYEADEAEGQMEDDEDGGIDMDDEDQLAQAEQDEADAIAEQLMQQVVEYILGVQYTWPGWDGHLHWVLPGTYALDNDTVAALGPNSTLDSIARVDLVFNVLGLVDPDTLKPDGSSGAWVTDVYITDTAGTYPATFAANAVVGESAIPLAGAGQPLGAASATIQGVAPPTHLSDFHSELGFRDPQTRRSYDSAAVRVDHPGVKYSARLVQAATHVSAMDYGCPWLRANYIENCCWLTCIIELVNTAMRRKVLTYERLWSIMGKRGAFDPAEAKMGFSIRDLEPVFEHFDRAVTVLDGENNVVYRRERSSQRKKNHIRPEAWSFLMTEHHVVCLNENDLFRTNVDHKRLNFGAGGTFYDEVIINHPYEVVAPDFPPRETKKPPMLESFDAKAKTATVKGLVNNERKRKAKAVTKLIESDKSKLLERESEDDERVTLHEAMFHRRFDGTYLTVITPQSMITHIVLTLIRHYKYKPSITINSVGAIASCTLVSLDNRAMLAFRCILPGSIAEDESQFQSVAEVMTYLRTKHALTAKLLKPENQSYMHESVAQICHTYTRGGFFHMFQDASMFTNPDVKFNSCDVNRLYPSTLLCDELPRVDLFNRFEAINTTGEYHRLKDHDLIIVSINDSACVYMSDPINLCFKKNLDKFLLRANTQLCEPAACHTTLERPTGYTLVTVHAVLCTHMGPSTVGNAISTTWHDTTLSRAMRKFAINSAIGCLGKRFNSGRANSANYTPSFCNREEAALHAEQTGERIISVEDELYFALPNVDKVPRLQGGYLMHLWVLDHSRWAMQETYDKFVQAGVNVAGIICDELYYPSSQQHIVDQFIYDGDSDSFAAFGRLKTHAQNVPVCHLPTRRSFAMTNYIMPPTFDLNIIDETCVPMGRSTVLHVSPNSDEWYMPHIKDYTRLLIKANVPGAGKSHAVLSMFADNCVVVCPTNSLCVEFTKKYPGCIALTLHKFLRVRMNDDDGEGPRQYNGAGLGIKHIECNRVLLLDEIYMYPQSLLNKLYVRLCVTQATHVYATGDPNQLPPVEDDKMDRFMQRNKENEIPDDDLPFWDPTMDSDATYMSLHERRSRAIDHLFPKQLTLTKCKRATHTGDNVRMEHICRQLRDPYAEIGAVDVVKKHFLNITFADAVTMLKTAPENHVAVCYYNATCNAIAKLVFPQGVIHEGVRLVNRQRYVGKGGVVLHVNYEYVVKEILDNQVVLEDDNDSLVAVPLRHVERHMMWWRTRTCHSLQGTSVSGSVVIFDLECPHMSKEFIYVALTRARNLAGVCYVA